MYIRAGQIYFLRKAVRVSKANYGRPCLVLRVSKVDLTVCFLTTNLQYRECEVPIIYKSDPDFQATGLSDSSCILPDLTPDVSLSYLDGAKLLGRATGDFKMRVEEWYGMPLK